jgi:hypothetical protein
LADLLTKARDKDNWQDSLAAESNKNLQVRTTQKMTRKYPSFVSIGHFFDAKQVLRIETTGFTARELLKPLMTNPATDHDSQQVHFNGAQSEKHRGRWRWTPEMRSCKTRTRQDRDR